MLGLSKVIKNFDKFGHYVALTYKQEGSHHKTFYGGLISFFIFGMYLGYVAYYMFIMYSVAQTTISYVTSYQDFNNFTPIKFSDTNLFFFIWIANNKTGLVARYDDVKHLFKIYSYIYTVDYLAGNYGNKANITEARQCEKSDWQVSDSIKEQYSQIYESGIKPEYNPMTNLTCFDKSIQNSRLQRDVRNYKGEQIYFQIDYVGCKDKNNPVCLDQMDQIKDYVLTLQVYQEAMDFNQLKDGVKPVYSVLKQFPDITFNDDSFIYMYANLKQNLINTFDTWYNSWIQTWTNEPFYDVNDVLINTWNRRNVHNDTLYIFSLQISPEVGNYFRQVFNIMQFIGSIGGVIDILIFFFSFFVSPYSEFSFIVSAIQNLYMVRVKNKKYQSLFDKFYDEKSFPIFHKAIEKFQNNQTLQNFVFETQNNFVFILSNLQAFKLFLFKQFYCYKCRKDGNTIKLYKLYKKGENLYNKEANIERVLNNLQNIKAYFSLLNKHLDKKGRNSDENQKMLEYEDEITKFIFYHFEKKVIDFEDEDYSENFRVKKWYLDDYQNTNHYSNDLNQSQIQTITKQFNESDKKFQRMQKVAQIQAFTSRISFQDERNHQVVLDEYNNIDDQYSSNLELRSKKNSIELSQIIQHQMNNR